jgi:arginase
MRITLIYATWPDTPFGMTWHKFAESLQSAGLAQRLADAGHDVEEHVLIAGGPQATELRGAFELSGEIGKLCRAALERGAFPVVACGSCAVSSLGVMAGIGDKRTGILWMDTHPDLNTPETTATGLFDGMSVATVLGKCWRHMAADVAGLRRPGTPRDLCLYGARDIDPGEAHFIAANDIPIVRNAAEVVHHLGGCERTYLHLDMDVHDPATLRANKYEVPGGPTPDAVRGMLIELAYKLPVSALSVASLDPETPDGPLAIAAAIAHIQAVCDSRKAA